MQVGFSTGAVSRSDIEAGVELSEQFDAPLVELSSLSELELPQLERVVGQGRASRFERVSMHGPAKHRQIPELELVARLDALGGDVVMHPDVFEVPARWARLGARLLVENNDSRKGTGRTVAELEGFFEELPEASFCLDVSHALDVGGPDLARDLARRFGDRLVQLHAGCACGKPEGWDLSGQLCASVAEVCSVVGRALPVVLERTTPASERDALRGQLEAVAALR